MVGAITEAKIKLFTEKGFNPRIFSADALLDAAINAEEQAKSVGPFDPAFQHLSQYARDAFEAAQLAERLENDHA